MRGMTNYDFTCYLRAVAEDYEESGSMATALDYREAARRIDFLRQRLAEVKAELDMALAERNTQ